MPNGKPLISDLEILELFHAPLDKYHPRDEYLAKKHNLHIKQIYAILNKKRWYKWLEYGVSLRTGWLTPEGALELKKLKAQ